ncbi:helix-turn-helix domain-containing protein [Bdellovibrio sp. HCB337]|uniref:helix-turn-helix domain-containing protein n=1 Tax=Bdellovibrio sp. HCB337 TaxID=3394358 RepID=UPI0039A702AE
MKELELLTTDNQRKAFLHPLRSKILGMLAQQPLTITKVAQELKVHPANLTHHFRKLQDAGLIVVHEERDIGKVIERYYVAVARAFEIQQEANGANAKVLSFLKNDLAASIPNIKTDDSEKVLGLIQRARLDEDTFNEFAKELQALVKKFAEKSKDEGDTYALNLSLYPHSVDYGPLKKIHITKRKEKSK